MRTLICFLVLVVATVAVYRLNPRPLANYEFGGETMGTTYTIKIVGRILRKDTKTLQYEIGNLLSNLNSCLSTYDSESEISRFNRSQNTNAVEVSFETAEVARFSLEVAPLSNGALDPTVMPLVSLWGFGPDFKTQTIPSPADIKKCIGDVDYTKITVGTPPTLTKSTPAATLDFSALAKGYAVDRIAALLVTHGISNAFVEVGGEVLAMGSPQDRRHWRILIDSPAENIPRGQKTSVIIQLRNASVATSGDYRNYFNGKGRTFSHVLDPRTGYPVSNGVASATVVAQDCMTADALATAIMVLGPAAGLALTQEYSGAEALFILRNPDGSLFHETSPGFTQHLYSSRIRIHDL